MRNNGKTGGKKLTVWRISYLLCSLVYMAWIIYLSQGNFSMVHRQYRKVVRQLPPAKIEQIAYRELVQQCRKDLRYTEQVPRTEKLSPSSGEDTCLSWPAATLDQQQEEVRERLLKERSRTRQKLVLFYITFGVFFLILPPLFLYMLLSLFFWVFKNVHIVE